MPTLRREMVMDSSSVIYLFFLMRDEKKPREIAITYHFFLMKKPREIVITYLFHHALWTKSREVFIVYLSFIIYDEKSRGQCHH